MFYVHGGKLTFEISDNAGNYRWFAEGLETRSPEKHDFFRVFLDNGMEKEIAVFSKDQKGTVTGEDDNIKIVYPVLIDELKRQYDIKLTIYMKTVGNKMEYYAEVENNSDVRINEVECPFIELEVIASKDTSKDICYLSNALGQRIVNPIEFIKKNYHTEYMTGDYEHIWNTSTYPYPYSMPWFGVESNGHFIYVGRHDENFRTCSFSLGTSPRFSVKEELVFNISNYPAAEKGETIICGKGVVSLIEGNWKDGADIYKEFANSWYVPRKPVSWVKNFTGWQRVILKHQYGKIYFMYKDLVDIYKNGAKYGLDTLMVFGWWKGRFDNGYPNYEPDEALGGAEELKKAIKTIQDMGGNVILYNNGVLLDVTTDYYKELGNKIAKKNIDGAEYREYYQFSDYGMMLRTNGYKAFSTACHATEEWKEKLIENAKIKLQFNPDSIFYDQLGGHLPRFCFDKNHKHKNRVDEDASFKAENVKAVREILPEGKCIGTENVVDCLAPLFDYCHGCNTAGYAPTVFPTIYRYVFPDTIITNRFAHDEKEGFETELDYAFVNGLRYDVAMYRGRLIDISGQPNYGKYLKYLLDLKEEYREFFYEGKFIGDDTSIEKPVDIIANLFENKDAERLLILWNTSDKKISVKAYNKKHTLLPKKFKLVRL